MVDFGTTEDLGAVVAELQDLIDVGGLTPGGQSSLRTVLGLVMMLRDARLSGLPDEITLTVAQKALGEWIAAEEE